MRRSYQGLDLLPRPAGRRRRWRKSRRRSRPGRPRLAAPPRSHPAEMPRAKERDEQRAYGNERPFDDDVSPFGGKSKQEREADDEIKEPPQHIDHRRGFTNARR